MRRFALAALLLCGCASSGKNRYQVWLSQDDILERRYALQRVDDEIGLLGDEPLAGYLQSVGNGIGYPQVSFSVLNSEEPNAYAVDSGAVFVSRGMLALLNDEGELAAVLGHEVGHIAANHGKKREVVRAPFDALSKTLRRLLGLIKPSIGNRVGDYASTSARVVVLAPIARGQERRADEAAVALSAAADYDPLSLTHVLERMQAYVAAQTGSWLDDHPPVTDRVERMREHIASLGLPQDLAPKHPTLLPMLDGMVMDKHPFDGAALASKIVHPRFGIVYDVPPGWSTEREGGAVVSSGEGCTVLLESSTADVSPDELVRRNRSEGVQRVAVEKALEKLPGEVARTRAESAGIHVELVIFGDAERARILSGAWPVENAAACAPQFAATIDSVREPTIADIDSLPVVRLRIVVGHAGESLGGLLFRNPSAWTIERVAALNGLSPDHVFEHDTPIKVPRRETWSLR